MAKTKIPLPSGSIAPLEAVEQHIYTLRGQRVMLDSDLAKLYGVTTKRLNEQVRRNLERFPGDFAFQLEGKELALLRSQIATLKLRRGEHRKYLPYVFTEHGAVMLASVLNSPTAVAMSIQVVQAFVRLRSVLATHKEFAKRLEALEKKTDAQFKVVFDSIRQLIQPPATPRKAIGFHAMTHKILADKVKENAKNGFLGVKATQKFLSRKKVGS
jgi:phage regulator Rha-like protein